MYGRVPAHYERDILWLDTRWCDFNYEPAMTWFDALRRTGTLYGCRSRRRAARRRLRAGIACPAAPGSRRGTPARASP
jgi:hypothetical protein